MRMWLLFLGSLVGRYHTLQNVIPNKSNKEAESELLIFHVFRSF